MGTFGNKNVFLTEPITRGEIKEICVRVSKWNPKISGILKVPFILLDLFLEARQKNISYIPLNFRSFFGATENF